MTRNQQQIPNPDHYEQCPQYDSADAPHCHCEGINQADDNYWTEPPNLNG